MEYETSDSNNSDFEDSPPFVLNKQDMKIKDVVKENILPLLPAKALTRFRFVSNEWNEWVKSPLLAYQQSCRFKELSGFFCQNEFEDPTFVSLNASDYGVPSPSLDFLPERVDILSSCSGLLVCHGRDAHELYYICNPANKHWNPLPKPHLYHGSESGVILAFEPSARNIEEYYHLVCAVPMFGLLCFELYTSSTNSWTILNTTLLEMQDLKIKYNGFYMKGVAYWLTNTKKVIAIHVEEEVYEVIPLPFQCRSDGSLTQIRGELCYITMSFVSGNTYSIRINGGMDLSLKHLLKVSLGEPTGGPDRFQLLKALPCFDGEKLMFFYGDGIYSFDINDRIPNLITRGVAFKSVSAYKHLAYVNSLVQLH